MKRYLKQIIFLGAAMLVLASCSKNDHSKSNVDPFFSYEVDGFMVTFKNESTNAASVEWDFGDGETSTEENPTHEYPGKGKFVPTLTAIGTNGERTEASTVLRLAKASVVNLEDDSFDDWDAVTNEVVAGTDGGTFIKAKYDYDGTFVYVYFEAEIEEGDENPFDVYMDVDDSESTGFLDDGMPGGGYDYMLEGTIIDDWFDLFPFTGGENQDNWDFPDDPLNVGEFYKVGKESIENGILKVEFGIDRTKVPGLASTTGINIFVQLMDPGWSEAGFSPDEGTDAFHLDMTE